MSYIMALEPLATMSANPIRCGQVVDLPHDVARSLVRRGLAAKWHSFSLDRRPVFLRPMPTIPDLIAARLR